MNELPEANFIEIVLLYFGFRSRYQVENNSMLPVLKQGDQVLVKRDAKVKTGDIVIARHPFKKPVEMIKRIREINDNGNYYLVGDNLSESTDSRTFGAVSIECIEGKVVARLSNYDIGKVQSKNG